MIEEVFDEAASLAAGVAKRIVQQIKVLLTKKPIVNVVITGGRIGIATLEQIFQYAEMIDWSKVHLWWTDERFLADESTDRNDYQADQALLGRISIPPINLHRFPVNRNQGIRQASEQFANSLGNEGPEFDLAIIGIGEDGHVASIFPNCRIESAGPWVSFVSDSPKPPKERISLSIEALNCSDEIWVIASGPEKASAVGKAMKKSAAIPAGKLSGRVATRWFLDKSAAAEISA